MRKIVYLDYYEQHIKAGNKGFLRLEEEGELLHLKLQVSGLYATDTLRCPLPDGTTLRLEGGRGILEREYALPEAPDWYFAGRLRIPVSGSRYLQAVWIPLRERPQPECAEDIAPQEQHEENEIAGQPEQLPQMTADAGPEREKQTAEGQTGLFSEDQAEHADDITPQEQHEEIAGDAPLLPAEVLYEDKWEQLCHRFPRIRPFGDQRTYLSVTPEDFIIFPRQYQKLVHNSFLLHGYYNYRHLILGKLYRDRQILYYLGTPGIFDEREKMAAELFGFEAFEYAGDKMEEGMFGYYMRRVEI